MNLVDLLNDSKQFNETQNIICQYILNHSEDVVKMSARALAKETYTNASTIIRFVQKIGYENYNDFKIHLVHDLKEYQAADIKITEKERKSAHPLFIQWDERWGYSVYGDNMIAVNGCGPTAVAMVVSGLLCDPSVTPYKVAKFAEEQGYYAGESGTSWTLMSEGVQSFGIWGEELGLSRSEVFSALESGCPIICSMRPGDFTTTGHFIVLTKVENGKIKVNDPNSRIRSGQLWDYERLEPQIQNLWAFSRM